MASEACSLNSLDIFERTKIQSAITTNDYVEYKPISTISGDGGAIKFHYQANSDDFIDLSHTMISLKCKIQGTDKKTETAAADKVSTIQMPISSAFSQVIDAFSTCVPIGYHLTRPYHESIHS